MRSIGVLQGMRKKKHTETTRTAAFAAASLLAHFRTPIQAATLLASLLVMLTLCFPAISGAQEDKHMGTRNSGSGVITRDPATGDRVIQTPDPVPQQDYQGPQTIIVSPEVYPGGRPGGDRPRPPQRPQPRAQ